MNINEIIKKRRHDLAVFKNKLIKAGMPLGRSKLLCFLGSHDYKWLAHPGVRVGFCINCGKFTHEHPLEYVKP